MSKRFIQILTILITTAFVGLIAIQIYWVNNSILLQQQDFEFGVNQALKEVVHKLEKLEYYKQVTKRHDASKVQGSLTKDEKEKALLYDFNAGSHTDTIRVSTPKDAGLRAVPLDENPLPAVEESEEEEIGQVLKTHDSLMYSEWGEYGLEHSEILEQSFMEELLEGALTIDIIQSIEERVDEIILDSLIRQELDAHGVKAKYRFGVFNRYGQPEILTVTNEKYKVELSNPDMVFAAKLFPNDPVQESSILHVYFPHVQRYLLQNMWVMLSFSAVLMLVIMFAFSYTISTIYRQKKLSEIKNDFINNMTHELKTPISTISLACEALSDPDMMQSQRSLKTYVGMITDENRRLGQLVENVLRSAVLDKGEMDLRIETINVHELIKGVQQNIAIQVKKKGGTIETDLSALNPVIMGDRVHITNLVFNLIDNAIKYSPKDPKVVISSEDREGGVMLSFKDNGIGISKENQKKIFDRLYRVPTGNVHNVKGFGLGLSYVKAVVERHYGTIDVLSELNKGSNFIIYLPAAHEKSD